VKDDEKKWGILSEKEQNEIEILFAGWKKRYLQTLLFRRWKKGWIAHDEKLNAFVRM